MKRLRRIAWNTTAMLLLLLCAGIAGLWVRSYWVQDTAWLSYDPVTQVGRDVFLTSVSGRLRLQINWFGPQFRGGPRVGWIGEKDQLPTTEDVDKQLQDEADIFDGWNRRGFSFTRDGADAHADIHASAPHWGILLAIALPTVLLTARWRIKRRLVGTCANCGYDLRATPGRCPECGAIPARK